MTSLSHLRELLAKGLPGPWGVYQDTPHDPVQVNHPSGDICEMDTWKHRPDEREPDAHLIATSHNALPALLEIAEAALRFRDEASDAEYNVAWTALLAALDKVKP